MKYIYLITFVCLLNINIRAQIPSNDPHWKLIFEDDFTTLNTSAWKVFNNFDHYAGVYNPPLPAESWLRKLVFLNKSTNVRVDNGALIIQMNKENYTCPSSSLVGWGCSNQEQTGNSYQYTSGMVESVNQDYLYGYIEARIKIPDALGLNNAFWTINKDGLSYAEIDIFEMLPGATIDNIYHNNSIMSSNIHTSSPGSIPGGTFKINHVNNFTNYHIYSIEWTPDKILFYVDGKIVRNSTNPGIFQPSRIRFNIGFSDWCNPVISNPIMSIDYIRIYQLEHECSAIVNSCTYNFSSHNNKVKKSITIGGSGCSNNLISGQNVVLRATDGIEIKGDFSVPLGAEFYADVNQCY